MKSPFSFIALLVTAFATFTLPLQAAAPKVEVAIAVDGDTPPAKAFSKEVPKLYAFFNSKGTAEGDKLRCVWIAEDVGEVADKNTKIDEATLEADQDDFSGSFSLSRPTAGWPVGKYRVEIYSGDNVVGTAKFTIK